MPYSAEISRSSPAAILFLLDQSASMQDPFGGADQRGDAAPSKARVLADVVNRLLQDLILRCAKEDGVRDYFHVGVVGYGDRVRPLIRAAQTEAGPGSTTEAASPAEPRSSTETPPPPETRSATHAGSSVSSGSSTETDTGSTQTASTSETASTPETGSRPGSSTRTGMGSPSGTDFAVTPHLVPISHLAERPLRMEQRVKTVDGVQQTVKFPIWFEPHAKNGTPMCQALDFSAQIVRGWIDLHPRDFPPIVVNVTDGEATDGDPIEFAKHVRSYATDDGETLLFNAHLSSSDEPAVELPDAAGELPREAYALQLFQMSSPLPFSMRAAAEQEGYRVNLDTRGFVFNADPASLVRFLEIGTRPSNLR